MLGSRGPSIVKDSSPASGGEPRAVTPNEDETRFWYQQPKMLPRGDGVLFATYQGTTDEIASVGIYSLSSGESRLLIENGWHDGFEPEPLDQHRLEAKGIADSVVQLRP